MASERKSEQTCLWEVRDPICEKELTPPNAPAQKSFASIVILNLFASIVF